jgi:hypothetical protein
MSIVDERGRVAGRINLIDAVAAVAIVVLVPVAYAAYLLFRTPPATLRAVWKPSDMRWWASRAPRKKPWSRHRPRTWC